MSATGFLVLLIVTIAILMVLIMKVKLHPTFALFLSALFMGLVLGRFEAEGFGFTDILTTITGGFGGTLGSMGIPIMLGAILAMGVQDTGAAKAIANFFIKLFRGKNLELAPALTAYIVSIPVFGDITTILTSNIANVLSKRKHISMGKMAAFTQTGLNLTHAMVPPTPGILAVSILLGADLGLVIGWGILISLIAFALTWLVLRKWTDKEFVEPVPEVVAEIEETSSNDVKDILITGNDIPATFASFLTILIPVILIAGSSFIKMVVAEDSALYAWANIFGDKIVALGLGVIYTMLLAVFHKASVRKSNADATGKNPQSFREVVLNSWIARGLEIALPALLITGMGGAFAAVIKAAPAINDLAGLIEQSGVPGLLIPFLIGAIMFTAVGSMTTGGMTAAGVVGPMMVTLGLSFMFEEGSVRVLSYPLETVLAEKLETVVSRGIANTRGRDYYDIHTLLRLKADEINRDSLHEAVVATASRRGSLGKMGDYEAVLSEVRRSDMMRGIWSSYVSASPYAEGVDFEEAVDSAIELARFSELDDLD